MALPNVPTFMQSISATNYRAAETPAADWNGGVNKGGSNANGLGINTGRYDPKLQDWDTAPSPPLTKVPQLSQHIGGIKDSDNPPSGANPLRVEDGGPDDNQVAYVIAEQDTVQGAILDPSGIGAGNFTGDTVPAGSRCWGIVVIS